MASAAVRVALVSVGAFFHATLASGVLHPRRVEWSFSARASENNGKKSVDDVNEKVAWEAARSDSQWRARPRGGKTSLEQGSS
ncbi:hypothetical protein CSOJ01_00838 [Colletotrichum sojae]|uniref:Uncharacterized protein n=1 Tax=Colletotrichum sojae TaxID=2175907 RepID=A0A8H6JVW7_9PEZI|nr:hypothetical protein CSOJ01_00838 [Colletotrichum sojae]